MTGADNRRGCTARMRQEIICKFVTRRRQNGVSSRCRMRVGGSECLEKGSVAVGWQKTQLAGLEQEASWHGAVASCLPREGCLRSKRGEDGGRRKPAVEESQLERASRHTPVWRWGRERGAERTGWMVGRKFYFQKKIKRNSRNFKLKLSHNFFYYISMFSALLQVFYLYVLHVHMVYSILQCSFIFVLFNMLHILLIYILIFYIFLCSIFS